MNKIYQRIDWENYPSSATPLNEDNLNKMDYAIDKLDDRIVTHETTKLDIATGNTLVKNVTFTERTGVFTIEKLNGSKFTINTALEKISINFYFDPTTQKLALTLIDGTVQEIDLSALITQYEFLESDTITFEIDASGKVKANILNGSITGKKLEPNYLANVTLQAKNAKTSADNAKTSEELAYQYAEEAKESASQTAKSDAKNITYDNTESGLSATNVKDALDEVAQGSVSAITIDTTITDSTNAPLIYGKFKGYTLQNGTPTPDNPVEINGLAKDGAIEVKTTGKNIFGGLALENKIVGVVSGATKNEETGSVSFSGSNIKDHILFNDFKENTQYTFIFYGKNLGSSRALNVCIYYTDGTKKLMAFPSTDISHYVLVSDVGKTVEKLEGVFQDSTTLLYPNQCGIFEGIVTLDDFEPYKESTATIPTDAPLYEGDYLEVYADGSGKLVRKMGSITFDSPEDVLRMSFREKNYVAITLNVSTKKNNINVYSNHYTHPSIYDLNNLPENAIVVNHNGDIILKDKRFATFDEYKTWLQSNPVTVVYELAEPTETQLTAEQVAQFKKLCTFEPVTNVLCDGEVEIQYYKNTTSGVAVGTVHRMADNNKATYDGEGNVIADTYRTKEEIIPIDKGGTNATTTKGAEYNLLGNIQESTTAIADGNQIVFKRSTPSSTDGVLLYKKASVFWDYIKSKISSVLGLTETSYGGNAATATKASQDGDGNVISEAYEKKVDKRKYLFIGDSYSAHDANVVSACAVALGLSENQYYRHAQGGAGFTSSIRTFDSLLDESINSIANKDEIAEVIVLGGLNDIGYPDTTLYPLIQAFINKAKANYKNAVVKMGFIGWFNFADRIGAQTGRVVRQYKNACIEYGGFYLNGVEYAMHDYRMLGDDGIHPKDNETMWWIGKCVAQAIKTGHCSVNFVNYDRTITPVYDFVEQTARPFTLTEVVDNGTTTLTLENEFQMLSEEGVPIKLMQPMVLGTLSTGLVIGASGRWNNTYIPISILCITKNDNNFHVFEGSLYITNNVLTFIPISPEINTISSDTKVSSIIIPRFTLAMPTTYC